MQPRPILSHGKPLAAGRIPAVCAPLVARDHESLLAEAAAVAAKSPDLIEWRIDFFARIGDTQAVLQAAAALRAVTGDIPILFTRRSQREGGEPIAIDEPQVVALYRAVCAARLADLVDFETASEDQHVRAVRDSAHANGIGLVLSHHNFHRTPPVADMVACFVKAADMQADVAKLAVMPACEEDVLRLLEATAMASRQLAIPVVSMSMGGWGALSRLGGGMFGSALTFAVGSKASAPGQMPIEDMRAALDVLQRATQAA